MVIESGGKILTHGIGSHRVGDINVNYIFTLLPIFLGGTFTSSPIWIDLNFGSLTLVVASDTDTSFQALTKGAPLSMNVQLSLCNGLTLDSWGSARVPVPVTMSLDGLSVVLGSSFSNFSGSINNTYFPVTVNASVSESCIFITASSTSSIAGLESLSFQSVTFKLPDLASACDGSKPILARCNNIGLRNPHPLQFISSIPNFITFSLYNQSLSSDSYGLTPFIFLKDTTPPTIQDCPGSQSVTLPPGSTSDTSTLYWKEPLFSDNVGIQKLSGPFSTVNPGSIVSYQLTPKESPFLVRYQAWDAAGNEAQCFFTLSVDFITKSQVISETMGTTVSTSNAVFRRRRSLEISNSNNVLIVENSLEIQFFNLTVNLNEWTNELTINIAAPTGLRVVVQALPPGSSPVTLQCAIELIPINCTNGVTWALLEFSASPVGDEFSSASFQNLNDLQGQPITLLPISSTASASIIENLMPSQQLRWLTSDPRTTVSLDESYLYFGGTGELFSTGFSFTALSINVDFPIHRNTSSSPCTNVLTMNPANSFVSFQAFYPIGMDVTDKKFVVVRDFDPPRWYYCPKNMIYNASNNMSMASIGELSVTWSPEPVATDNIAVTFSNATYRPHDLFPITFKSNPSMVIYEAFDAAGNIGICSFNVSVLDITPPILMIPQSSSSNTSYMPINFTNTSGFPYFSTFHPSILDNSGNVILTFSINATSNLSGVFGVSQWVGFVGIKDTSKLIWEWLPRTKSELADVVAGSNPRQYVASIFATGARELLVTQTHLEMTPSSSNSSVNSSSDKSPHMSGAPTNASAVVNVTTTTTVYNIFSTLALQAAAVLYPGTYSSLISVTDFSGNKVEESYSILVQDFEPPVFTSCPSEIFLVATTSDTIYNLTFTIPPVTDNSRVANVSAYNASGYPVYSGLPVALVSASSSTYFKISFVAMDISGNKAQCNSTVVISPIVLKTIASASSSATTGMSMIIVGAVVGGVVGGALLFGVLIVLHQRRKRPADFAEYLNRITTVLDVTALGEGGIRTPREVNRESLKIINNLGKGQFGTVDKAIIDERKFSLPGYLCAVKQLLSTAATDMTALMEESAIMAQLDNDFCVRLIGVVTVGKPMMMIVEYCENGALNGYLQKNLEISEEQRILFAGDCCEGLAYLASKGFIHRDIAARNILVSSELRCKVSDFGMSRDTGQSESDYYQSRGGALPIRWCSPEVLEHRKFSQRSDVYAMGILLYEIWTKGASPYSEMKWNNQTVWTMVTSGYRLPCPIDCAEKIYDVMFKCWLENTHERPSAKWLCDFFREQDRIRSELQPFDQSEIEGASSSNPGGYLEVSESAALTWIEHNNNSSITVASSAITKRTINSQSGPPKKHHTSNPSEIEGACPSNPAGYLDISKSASVAGTEHSNHSSISTASSAITKSKAGSMQGGPLKKFSPSPPTLLYAPPLLIGPNASAQAAFSILPSLESVEFNFMDDMFSGNSKHFYPQDDEDVEDKITPSVSTQFTATETAIKSSQHQYFPTTTAALATSTANNPLINNASGTITSLQTSLYAYEMPSETTTHFDVHLTNPHTHQGDMYEEPVAMENGLNYGLYYYDDGPGGKEGTEQKASHETLMKESYLGAN